MANLNSECKKILKNLEENIKDKNDLEYARIQIFNLYNLFFDQITKNEELANTRMAEIAEGQAKMQDKIDVIAKQLKDIEKDIYLDDDDSEDYNFEIICPYCNKEFTVELNEVNKEVTCPECSNIIELDWGEDECNCDDCHHDCHHDEDEDM